MKTFNVNIILFLFVICLLLFLGIIFGYYIDTTNPLLGRKPILFLIGLLFFFYEVIASSIRRLKISEVELVQVCLYIMPLFLGFAFALFFFAATVGTLTVTLIPRLRLDLIGSQVFYIATWILLLNIILLISGTHKNKKISKFGARSSIPLSLIFILLAILFSHSNGPNGYLPPWHPAQFHSNPMFILLEIVALFWGLGFVAGLFFDDTSSSWLSVLSLLALFSFLILSQVGRITINRITYDFIFFGPLLLLVIAAVDAFVRTLFLSSKEHES